MLPPAGRREPCRLIRVAGAMGERRPRRASLLHRLVFSRQKRDPHRELSRTRRSPRSRRAVGVPTPSVVGLETRWKQRIAAARGGSQPLRPRIGRFLGVRQQTAEHGSPLGTFHTREVAGSKPAAPIQGGLGSNQRHRSPSGLAVVRAQHDERSLDHAIGGKSSTSTAGPAICEVPGQTDREILPVHPRSPGSRCRPPNTRGRSRGGASTGAATRPSKPPGLRK